MITDYFMITEKSNRLQVIMITDYDYPISERQQMTKYLNIFLVLKPTDQDVYCFLLCLQRHTNKWYPASWLNKHC